jgi:uncharacterized membrane protein YedE/YeeE
MTELLKQPWPWYVAGPLIGLFIPFLLLLTNKKLGVSSSFRHVCAACLPGKLPYFNYRVKDEIWNLLFVAGILGGGFIAANFLSNPNDIRVNEELVRDLSAYGISNYSALMPTEIFSWEHLLTARGFVMIVIGGFLVGFGTRYAGGCTSGHSIMGIANLQKGSLVATICFMIGGFAMVHLFLPFILKL